MDSSSDSYKPSTLVMSAEVRPNGNEIQCEISHTRGVLLGALLGSTDGSLLGDVDGEELGCDVGCSVVCCLARSMWKVRCLAPMMAVHLVM